MNMATRVTPRLNYLSPLCKEITIIESQVILSMSDYIYDDGGMEEGGEV